jgi:hypothetical protein
VTSGTAHSKHCTARRRFVVWLTHAPGLWLFYGETVPRRLRPANVVAAGATVLVIVVAVLATHGIYRLIAGLAVWVAGHVAWGTYFAWRLPEHDHDHHGPSREPPVRVRALQCDAECRSRAQHDACP